MSVCLSVSGFHYSNCNWFYPSGWRKEGVRINGIVPITTATTITITLMKWRMKVTVERFRSPSLFLLIFKTICFTSKIDILEDGGCCLFSRSDFSAHVWMCRYVWECGLHFRLKEEKYRRKQAREQNMNFTQ